MWGNGGREDRGKGKNSVRHLECIRERGRKKKSEKVEKTKPTKAFESLRIQRIMQQGWSEASWEPSGLADLSTMSKKHFEKKEKGAR